MLIEICVKNVFGRIVFYPECEKSIVLCNMLSQKSFTLQNVKHLKQAGFRIKAKGDEKLLEGVK